MNSNIRKDKCYRITIEEVNVGNEVTRTLEFDYQDREDLFNVVQQLQKSSGLQKGDATKVGVALRLLGPVMMQQRKHPLFVDFMPHFKTFMQNLKKTIKGAVKETLS